MSIATKHFSGKGMSIFKIFFKYFKSNKRFATVDRYVTFGRFVSHSVQFFLSLVPQFQFLKRNLPDGRKINFTVCWYTCTCIAISLLCCNLITRSIALSGYEDVSGTRRWHSKCTQLDIFYFSVNWWYVFAWQGYTVATGTPVSIPYHIIHSTRISTSCTASPPSLEHIRCIVSYHFFVAYDIIWYHICCHCKSTCV